MSDNNNNLIENLSDKVKAFLQSPDDFPVLEPHQWYNAIIKFVQTESIAALNKHYGNDGDQASISATGLSPAEQQQQAKERKIKKIDLEKELLIQIQLDLVHNLTNGTIEDYWLMYQQALREEQEKGDDNEGKTNGTASASKTNGNNNDVNKKTRKNASILDTIDLTRLTWPEIEKVAWKNYRIYLEKKAEEEERQRKKQQQDEDEDEEHHQHDENGDEVPVAPSEIVSPDSKNKQQQPHHATMLDEKTLREREKKIAKDEANINNDSNDNNNNSNKNNINLEDETVLEHLRNDALRPFRVQYERAFAILDKQLFDHTGSLIELDAFCQWTTVSFNPPYEQKEGEPNNRLGSIVNWLYLPNYAMNQDEDLVIDSYPLLREVRYIARDFPDCNLVKEGYCLEIFAHQTRDQFCGTMIQLADKPWSHSYPVIMSTFASSLRILAQTEKMVQIRDKRRKMKKLKEMTTATTTTSATESRKDDDDDDATTTGSATTMSSTTTATTTESSSIKRSPNYYYGSTLIKILSRAKPSPQQQQQQPAEKNNNSSNQQDNNNDNDDTATAAPPQQQIMGQEGNTNSEESNASVEIISPVLSPRANDDDDDDENDDNEANDQKDEKDLGKGRRYHLSKADAAEIACTMTRCAPPSDFAAVIAAVREYEIIPPKELNNNNTSTNSEKVPCYDIVIPSLHLPVVVFKDPSLGFLCRSSTLAEDWCVIQ